MPVKGQEKTMNFGSKSRCQSLSILAVSVLCTPILMISASCTDNKALAAATEEIRKIPDMELWVSADDLPAKEGATVTKWPDRTSNHWDLTSAGGIHTLALHGMNERPALHFDGKQNGKDKGPFGAMLTDAKFFDETWKGPMSIFVVARQDALPSPENRATAIWTALAPGARDKVAQLTWGCRDELWTNVDYVKDRYHCQCGNPADVNIYGVSFDGKTQSTWINCVEFDKIEFPGDPQLHGALCLGNHVVGRNGFYQFGGYISEVLVFKRGLSLAQCQAVNRYLQTKYNLTRRQVVLEGHSQFNYLVPMLDKRLPGWDINNAAIGGMGMHMWVGETKKFAAALHPGAQNIAIVAGGDNDLGRGGTQVETAEANYKTWALAMRAAGWKTIVSCTPPRTFNAAYPEYSADREKFNAWLRANYQTFADGLYDIDVIAPLADATNLKYYKPDGVHLTTAGYELTATEIARVVELVSHGRRN
jgi:hypothetical protein